MSRNVYVIKLSENAEIMDINRSPDCFIPLLLATNVLIVGGARSATAFKVMYHSIGVARISCIFDAQSHVFRTMAYY